MSRALHMSSAIALALLSACAEAVERRDVGPELGSDVPLDAGPDTPLRDALDGSPDGDVSDGAGDDRGVSTRVLSEAGDWPDCLDDSECPGFSHGFTGFTVELDPSTGELLFEGERYDVLEGIIETSGVHPFGYDTDFIGVRAPARTVVEIIVEATGGAPLDPRVTTFDGGRPGGGPAFREITTNNDRALGDTTARTMVAAPYSDVPFFVWVDDDRNWTGASAVGGASYRYRVSFVTTGFFPIEVDVSSGAVTQPGFVDLASAGDMHFYRFRPLSGAWQVRLETASGDFVGALIGFDTGGGDLRPVGLAGDGTPSTPILLGDSGFGPAGGEYVFGVTDWFGRGSNLTGTRFDYTLFIEPEGGNKAR